MKNLKYIIAGIIILAIIYYIYTKKNDNFDRPHIFCPVGYMEFAGMCIKEQM